MGTSCWDSVRKKCNHTSHSNLHMRLTTNALAVVLHIEKTSPQRPCQIDSVESPTSLRARFFNMQGPQQAHLSSTAYEGSNEMYGYTSFAPNPNMMSPQQMGQHFNSPNHVAQAGPRPPSSERRQVSSESSTALTAMRNVIGSQEFFRARNGNVLYSREGGQYVVFDGPLESECLSA